jgi:hypothetical protein
MNNPMTAAAVRALLGGVLSFGAVTLTTYQGQGFPHNWNDAFVAGGVAALTYLLTRGGFEGIYDQNRDNANPPAVAASDVGGVNKV